MKRYLSLGMILAGALVMVSLKAFADDIEVPTPTESWLLQVLTWLSTVKGMSSMAIAAGVTQLLMVGFKTPLASFTGRWRFVIVSLLSVVGLVLGGLATGSTLTMALGATPVLNAFQVFVNQAWKQLFTEKGSA